MRGSICGITVHVDALSRTVAVRTIGRIKCWRTFSARLTEPLTVEPRRFGSRLRTRAHTGHIDPTPKNFSRLCLRASYSAPHAKINAKKKPIPARPQTPRNKPTRPTTTPTAAAAATRLLGTGPRFADSRRRVGLVCHTAQVGPCRWRTPLLTRPASRLPGSRPQARNWQPHRGRGWIVPPWVLLKALRVSRTDFGKPPPAAFTSTRLTSCPTARIHLTRFAVSSVIWNPSL